MGKRLIILKNIRAFKISLRKVIHHGIQFIIHCSFLLLGRHTHVHVPDYPVIFRQTRSLFQDITGNVIQHGRTNLVKQMINLIFLFFVLWNSR